MNSIPLWFKFKRREHDGSQRLPLRKRAQRGDAEFSGIKSIRSRHTILTRLERRPARRFGFKREPGCMVGKTPRNDHAKPPHDSDLSSSPYPGDGDGFRCGYYGEHFIIL